MNNLTEQDVIDYAREKHNIPAAYAKNWYQYWSGRNWITTNGKIIFDWRGKFDWWVLDHKHLFIIPTKASSPATKAAELYQLQLQQEQEKRERDERIIQQERADPVIRANIEAIQQRIMQKLKN